MEIYVVFKVAAEKTGERILVSTEKAFKDVTKAQAFLKSSPQVWDEVVQGIECTCERAIHQVIVE